MEIAQVRKRVKQAIDGARLQAQQRRQRVADAQRAYERFLTEVATPVTRQVQNALRAEALEYVVFTPEGGVRLSSDHRREDFAEITLDAEHDPPQVLGRIGHSRGSRTHDDERPLKSDRSIEELTEDDVLDFLTGALRLWLGR